MITISYKPGHVADALSRQEWRSGEDQTSSGGLSPGAGGDRRSHLGAGGCEKSTLTGVGEGGGGQELLMDRVDTSVESGGGGGDDCHEHFHL